MVNTGWYNSLCKSAVKWFFFVFLWHKKANVVLMISVWGGRKPRGFASRLPHSPRGQSASLHAETHTRQPPFSPRSAAGVGLHLSSWLMKQARQGFRERQESRSRPCAASHTHTHISSLLLKHFFFVLSVSVTAETEDTGSVDMHTERHDIRSSADTYNVMA